MAKPAGVFPPFEDWFRAVNGSEPFPWQARLAAEVAAGGWPDVVGIPTGMGKTAAIDIAIWALARDAALQGRARSAATRIWYVVNRRLLVDAGHERALRLQRLLKHPAGAGAGHREVVEAVATALEGAAALGVEEGPLQVVRLRGGAELGARPPDVTQPAILLSTVAMFGSRLLFRGYGSSRFSRPVDAAMAGIDTLVLVDEAHLAAPLLRLVQALAEVDAGSPAMLLPAARSRPRVVSLTATAQAAGRRFDLDGADRVHAVIRERLYASKPGRLIEVGKSELARRLAAEAASFLDRVADPAVVVFCNQVSTALSVKHELDRIVAGRVATLLLTGRMREREADRRRRELTDPDMGAPAGGVRRPRTRPLIAVATQTLEVGADLDFDFLVTQSCGTRALVQRLGRLNRMGHRGHAEAVVVHSPDAAPEPYGDEPARLYERLASAGEPLDFSPENLGALLGEPQDEPERSGEILDFHLWEFAKTSWSERDEPGPELFFDRLDDPDRDVSVCWRAFLPEDTELLIPAVRESEAVEVPIREARNLGLSLRRLNADRKALERVAPDELRPGDVVVLAAGEGHYGPDGWDPDARETVLDVSLLRDVKLWLESQAIRALVAEPLPEAALALLDRARSAELGPEEAAEAARALVAELRGLSPHPWLDASEWEAFLGGLARGRLEVDPLGELPPLLTSEAAMHRATVEIRSDALDELSLELDTRRLVDHLLAVEKAAGRMAAAAGVPEGIARITAFAARAHDVGKADYRFQRRLDPDALLGRAWDELLAKSPASILEDRRNRIAASWPEGGRHEALSGRLVEGWLRQTALLNGWEGELLLHLVMTHHGRGRPLVLPALGEPCLPVVAELEGVRVSVPGDLSHIDWAQPARFRRLCERFGYWGLALLETIVRQADWAASGAGTVT